jgi:hypothetical protein
VTVHYPYLLLALLLLWTPRNWLRYGAKKKTKPSRRPPEAAQERDPLDKSIKPLTEGMKSRNWVDFFRAAVGAYVIVAIAMQSPDGRPPSRSVLALQGGLLLVGLLIQMVRFEGRLSLFAPIFFLQGMSVAVVGGVAGMLAMIGSWALTPVLPGASAILFVQGVLVLIFGYLFGDVSRLQLLMMSGLVWGPVLVSILLSKRLSASFDKRVKVVGRDPRPRAGAAAGGGGGGGD